MKPNIPKGKDPLKDRIFIDQLYDLKSTDLYDLHDRLWYEHFTPVRKLTKDEKDFIRIQLNLVGAEIKLASETAKNKCSEVIIVQPSTTFEVDELGPNRKEVIYIDVEKPLQIISSFKARAGKVGRNVHPSIVADEDLLGSSDDDLLGDAPAPGKSLGKVGQATLAKTTGGKTNYEIIKALADKHGNDKDKIQQLSGLPRKAVTDNLWRWNKEQAAKKKGGKK